MKKLTVDIALALAYFKENFPAGDDAQAFSEAICNGGDYEFTVYILEQVLPDVEEYLSQYEIERIDKYYLFYGDTFPSQYKLDKPSTHNELTACIESALTQLQTMRGVIYRKT